MPTEERSRREFWIHNFERRITVHLEDARETEWVSYCKLKDALDVEDRNGMYEFFYAALKKLIKQKILDVQPSWQYDLTGNLLYCKFRINVLQKLAAIE